MYGSGERCDPPRPPRAGVGSTSMLRIACGLTALGCVLLSSVWAAEVAPHQGPAHAAKPPAANAAEVDAARLLRVEVVVAEVRGGDAAKQLAADATADPKAVIQRLDSSGKLDGLARVQLTTLDGQKASFQVDQRVGRIISTQRTPMGQINNLTVENVGMVLGLVTRIRGDGTILIDVDLDRSQLGPADEGPVIAKPTDGEPIRSPGTEHFMVHSTIAARSGQSVAVGSQQTKRAGREGALLIVVTPEVLANK